MMRRRQDCDAVSSPVGPFLKSFCINLHKFLNKYKHYNYASLKYSPLSLHRLKCLIYFLKKQYYTRSVNFPGNQSNRPKQTTINRHVRTFRLYVRYIDLRSPLYTHHSPYRERTMRSAGARQRSRTQKSSYTYTYIYSIQNRGPPSRSLLCLRRHRRHSHAHTLTCTCTYSRVSRSLAPSPPVARQDQRISPHDSLGFTCMGMCTRDPRMCMYTHTRRKSREGGKRTMNKSPYTCSRVP